VDEEEGKSNTLNVQKEGGAKSDKRFGLRGIVA